MSKLIEVLPLFGQRRDLRFCQGLGGGRGDRRGRDLLGIGLQLTAATLAPFQRAGGCLTLAKLRLWANMRSQYNAAMIGNEARQIVLNERPSGSICAHSASYLAVNRAFSRSAASSFWRSMTTVG
jgi:hypothetical protein